MCDEAFAPRVTGKAAQRIKLWLFGAQGVIDSRSDLGGTFLQLILCVLLTRRSLKLRDQRDSCKDAAKWGERWVKQGAGVHPRDRLH